MLCYRLEGCNVDPLVGLLIVICFLVVVALLLKRDSMAGMFRGAVKALLNTFVKAIENRLGTRDNEQKDKRKPK